jgi:hypothetical protein
MTGAAKEVALATAKPFFKKILLSIREGEV